MKMLHTSESAKCMTIKARIFNWLIGLDQFLWVTISLGYGYPDETISSASYRYEHMGHSWAKIARPTIDFLFFWEVDHCRVAYESEMLRKHSPKPLTPSDARDIAKVAVQRAKTLER